MNILALEPYYGGSHRAFLDGWAAHSRHRWDILTYPPHKWKWRMRHAAIGFARQLSEAGEGVDRYDLVFASDMLNLAEFKGLAPREIGQLPSVLYFHENQLTYPVRHPDVRDFHLGMINISSALAADRVWFNSEFHRSSFASAAERLIRRMPDQNNLFSAADLQRKSLIMPPGIDASPVGDDSAKHPPVILWAARWEYDKNPQMFFSALDRLRDMGYDFKVSVIGQQFEDSPDIFDRARASLGDRVLHWGYQDTRAGYEAALSEADIVVSTAEHEFFGVGIVEAVAAGAYPLLPNRLAYPELFGPDAPLGSERYFYDGTHENLVTVLGNRLRKAEAGKLWEDYATRGRALVRRFFWGKHAPVLDDALEETIDPD